MAACWWADDLQWIFPCHPELLGAEAIRERGTNSVNMRLPCHCHGHKHDHGLQLYYAGHHSDGKSSCLCSVTVWWIRKYLVCDWHFEMLCHQVPHGQVLRLKQIMSFKCKIVGGRGSMAMLWYPRVLLLGLPEIRVSSLCLRHIWYHWIYQAIGLDAGPLGLRSESAAGFDCSVPHLKLAALLSVKPIRPGCPLPKWMPRVSPSLMPFLCGQWKVRQTFSFLGRDSLPHSRAVCFRKLLLIMYRYWNKVR